MQCAGAAMLGLGLARRIANPDTPRRAVTQWAEQRNAAQAKVNWHLTTDQARVKVRSLYASVER